MSPRLRSRAMNSINELCRDDEFFYTLIVFRVEDSLFRVFREPFICESEVFAGMFDLPVSESMKRDGTDEAHPLHLEGIRLVDFRPFLKALHAPQYHEPLNLSQDEWMSVLELSHMWGFVALREQAIKQLNTSDLGPFRTLRIARNYDIPAWVPKAYSELVDRKEMLTDDEVKELEWVDAFAISRYREQKMERLVTHFKTGHKRTRRCGSGHYNDIQSQSGCRKSSCGQLIIEEVDDGCEIFDVPGAPKKPRTSLGIWGAL
ncbi:hypothetical protein ACEPAI_7791 [Sanghuangporus weigelae]